MNGEQPARYCRSKRERHTGSTVTDCCGAPIIRKRINGVAPCDYCGTHLAMTDKGHIFTSFGENYFQVREKIAESVKNGTFFTGIPVEMPIKRAKVLVE